MGLELGPEMQALDLYRGRHICQCYDSDETLGAMLLEPRRDGHNLWHNTRRDKANYSLRTVCGYHLKHVLDFRRRYSSGKASRMRSAVRANLGIRTAAVIDPFDAEGAEIWEVAERPHVHLFRGVRVLSA